MHIQILSHLDLPSLLKATSVNKYFHALLSKNLIKDALLRHEATLLENWKSKDVQSRLCWMPDKSRNRTWFEAGQLDKEDYDAVLACYLDDHRPCYSCLRLVKMPVVGHLVAGTCWDLNGCRAGERVCWQCKSGPHSSSFLTSIMREADQSIMTSASKPLLQILEEHGIKVKKGKGVYRLKMV
jgi:hypothetical protein